MASSKQPRGARSAPRSSFRAKSVTKTKPKTKPKPKPKSKPAKRRAKAKAPAKQPKATPAKAKATARATKATPAKAKVRPSRAPEIAERVAARRPEPASGHPQIALGEITCPSGTLAIFDVGLVGYLPREALEPAIVKASVPADRPLRVVGARVGTGRFGDCWDHVAVIVGDGEITHAKKLGEAGVDFARLILMDHGALDHWQHEDSLDGKADFLFWGRDEVIVARVLGAPRTKEGYGWTDLPLAEAEAKADLAARKKAEHGWAFAMDLRPHSHHFHALAAARASKLGAGTLELAGSTLLLLFTSWGDGVFPIFVDLDADDRPVRVRIQLATTASHAAMTAVNR